MDRADMQYISLAEEGFDGVAASVHSCHVHTPYDHVVNVYLSHKYIVSVGFAASISSNFAVIMSYSICSIQSQLSWEHEIVYCVSLCIMSEVKCDCL